METNKITILNQQIKKSTPLNANKAEAELCRRSFYYFVKTFWNIIIQEEPIYNWHIKYICDVLQNEALRVKNREDSKFDAIIINVPPGSTKSTLCSQMFPLYCWINDPTIKLITASNTKELSMRDSTISRDILRSEKFQALFPEIQIKGDQDNKAKYENTLGGKRTATSVGGSIVGEHAHISIMDDPLNPKETPSEAQIKATNSFCDYVMTTRKINKKVSIFILVMQRLNENDPSGHLLSNKGLRIKHICLPATESDVVSPIELKEEYLDGLLDPIRMDHADLLQTQAGLGSYAYAGQYDQTPSPKGGGILRSGWFGTFELASLRMKAKQMDMQLIWNFTIDGAYTSDTTNDQTAMLSYCEFMNDIYIRNILGVWEELPELQKTIKAFAEMNGYTPSSRIYVEPKASGLPIVQTLKRTTKLNMIIDKAPTADKVSRARSIAPVLEAGRVYVLRDGLFIESFSHQIDSFPNGKLKDKVDTLVMAIQRFNERKGSIIATAHS